MEAQTNTMRDFMKSNYGNDKLDKSSELNESMSIKNSSPDEYTRKINSLGGSSNGNS